MPSVAWRASGGQGGLAAAPPFWQHPRRELADGGSAVTVGVGGKRVKPGGRSPPPAGGSHAVLPCLTAFASST